MPQQRGKSRSKGATMAQKGHTPDGNWAKERDHYYSCRCIPSREHWKMSGATGSERLGSQRPPEDPRQRTEHPIRARQTWQLVGDDLAILAITWRMKTEREMSPVMDKTNTAPRSVATRYPTTKFGLLAEEYHHAAILET